MADDAGKMNQDEIEALLGKSGTDSTAAPATPPPAPENGDSIGFVPGMKGKGTITGYPGMASGRRRDPDPNAQCVITDRCLGYTVFKNDFGIHVRKGDSHTAFPEMVQRGGHDGCDRFGKAIAFEKLDAAALA